MIFIFLRLQFENIELPVDIADAELRILGRIEFRSFLAMIQLSWKRCLSVNFTAAKDLFLAVKEF